MDFQVLGPVTGHQGATEVELGGPKQRLVLAMLLVARGATVSLDALMEGLWSDSLPATARKTLQGYVHHLRSKIGDDLRTDKAGYSLQVDDTLVDERVFEANHARGRELLEVDPAAASEHLTEALALWRGNPFADLDGAPVLRPEITRLTEARQVALGDRVDADLALGRHDTLIGELESLTVEYPLQERFRAQQMLALYRSGRHGEALRAFTRTRNLFIDEMGIEPSAQLRALEEQILARADSLEIVPDPEAGSLPTGSRALRGYELREEIGSDSVGALYRGYQRSVGRQVAIRVISGDLVNDPLFIGRYEADVARVANLNHPNVVSVQDTWREPGHVCQVMQWIEGARLDSLVTVNRPSRTAALKIVEQIGGALDVAHDAGVVHGDLGPHKVVVDTAGDAYLTDFAIGCEPGDESDDRSGLARVAHTALFGAEPARGDGGWAFLGIPEMGGELKEVFDTAFSDNGYARPGDFVRALRVALGGDVVELAGELEPGRSELRCPFKGLRAFQAADADDFFGRDGLVTRLLGAVGSKRLVTVVGPSGSGKSSLVKAGLVPRLVATPNPPLVAEMYPGAYPFNALEDALRSIAVRDEPISDRLIANERGLLRVVDSLLPPDGTELVLVIDQFEELFAMVASESARALFLESLATAVADPSSRLRVVLTLRADFFDRPLRYADFGAHVEAGLVPVTMPDDNDLAATIERPGAAIGLGVEPGLVEEIIRDVKDEPGGLPLLQYMLTELFETRTSNELTLASYRSSGGVLGALGSRAESLYIELSPAGRRAMHQAFLRLITVDEGADNVRRRVTRADLGALEVDAEALEEGLRTFGAHRLLTFDSDPISRAPTVEVAHEALLREWPRVRTWIEDERDQLVLRKRLNASMQEWIESDEDPAYLLGGARLTQFEEWATSTDMALTGGERAFLQASGEHGDRQARAAASRRRTVMSTLVAAALIAAGFGVYALVQRNDAADEARVAETARLGSQAGFVVERDRQMALLMAVETFRRDPGFEGISALQRVLVDADRYMGTLGAGTEYVDVHWVTENRLLGSTPTELHLIDATSGEVVALPVTLDGDGGVLASSPTGLAAVVVSGGGAVLVDVRDGALEALPQADGSQSVAISDDGTTVAVGHRDGTVRIVDRASGEVTASVRANPTRTPDDIDLGSGVGLSSAAAERLGGISVLAFDSSGERVVAGGGVFLRAWEVDDLSPAGPEIVHTYPIDDFNGVALEPRWTWIDPDDGDIVVVAADSVMVRWRLSTGEQESAEPLPAREISAVDAGDGDPLILAADGRVVRPNGAESFTFDVQESRVAALAVDRPSERFAVATSDGIVIGALDGSRLIARAVPVGATSRPTLTRDGATMSPGLESGGLLDLSSDPPTPIPFVVDVEIAESVGSSIFEISHAEHADVVLWTSEFMEMRNAYELGSGGYLGDFWGSFAPAWSGDGRRVALVDRAGNTRVEDVETGMPLYLSAVPIALADFDSTGDRIVLVPADRSPSFLIDLETGAETQLPEMSGGVISAAFTPTGDEIVTIGATGSVWLIDLDRLQLIRELEDSELANESSIMPPVITADGRWLFSSTDGMARVWDLETGRQLGKPFPSAPGGRPWAIADGDVLRIVTPLGGDALVWDMDVESWADLACEAAGRNMTDAEWEAFGPRDAERQLSCPEISTGEDPQ